MSTDSGSGPRPGTEPMHVEAGDFDLNYQYPIGAPTLIPSPGLEERLDFRRSWQRRASSDGADPPPCAVHIHGFHLAELRQLLDELTDRIRSFDLYITTDTSAKQEAIRALLLQHPLATAAGRWQVIASGSTGRNVGALLLDAYGHLQDYACALHLHTKRSVHTELAESWRASLIDNLIGSAELISDIRRCFAEQKELGLLMPQTCAVMRQCLNWGSNFDMASLIWNQQQSGQALQVEAPLVFPVGMMFWFRPQALEPLRRLCQRLQPLPLEPLPLDGSSLHALERLVAHCCEVEGFQWRMICGSGSSTDLRAEALSDGTPERLSVLTGRPGAYLQACARLAERTRRQQAELAFASEALENSTERLLQLEDELARLQEALEPRQRRGGWWAMRLLKRLRQRRWYRPESAAGT